MHGGPLMEGSPWREPHGGDPLEKHPGGYQLDCNTWSGSPEGTSWIRPWWGPLVWSPVADTIESTT